MANEEQQRIDHLLQEITARQCEYLKSVTSYSYNPSDELAEQLVSLGLIWRYGNLLIATDLGREVANLC
jgi:hypothetical protein